MNAARTIYIGLAIATVGFPCAAHAQTPLRWKLEPGQSLVVEVRQRTTSHVGFSGKMAEAKIDLTVEYVWSVGEAADTGTTITQKIDRIVLQLDTKAGTLKYDSADPKRPSGPARDVADAVQPILGAQIAIVMTARGEIRSAKPANEAAEKLFAAGGAADPPGVFSKKSVETLLRQPLAVLPEQAVDENETWTVISDLDAAAGKFKQTTTYRLAGTEEQEGQQLLRVEHSATLEPAAAPPKPDGAAVPLVLKSHEQSGHYLFSPDLGRLVSASQTQKLTTERPYRETTIVVTLDSTQTTTIKPAK
jgi:hypothetical protein